MLGVWANFLAVLVGGGIGALLRGGIPEKYRTTINAGLALCVMLIGISGAIKTSNVLIVIVSIVLGSLAGELLRIEHGLQRLGDLAQRRLSKGDSRFADAFVNTSLLVCVGAMVVVGSLEAGLENDPQTLLAKSAIDFVACIIFGSTMGPGVMLASVPILLYQGGIAVLAKLISGFLSEALIGEMSAVGSVLIIALGFNMLEAGREKIRVGNMLPAVLVPCLWFPIAEWIGKVLGNVSLF